MTDELELLNNIILAIKNPNGMIVVVNNNLFELKLNADKLEVKKLQD